MGSIPSLIAPLSCVLLVVVAVMSYTEGTVQIILLVCTAVALGGLGVRAMRISVVIERDQLLVRNAIRNYRIPRGNIDKVLLRTRIVPSIGKGVWLVLTDGRSICIDVTRYYWFTGGLPELNRPLHRLQRWLADEPGRPAAAAHAKRRR
jgi:hypothetical protein